MFRQYLFLPLFFALMLGMRWFSTHGELAGLTHSRVIDPARVQSQVALSVRQELMEDLDRLVTYENYYHAMEGRFTLLLNRVGFRPSPRVLAEYDIRVQVATADLLLIQVVSEKGGQVLDRVTVDQDFQVHSSFVLPAPDRRFLVAKALTHLKRLREAPEGVLLPERGIYTGYFDYSVVTSSNQEPIAVALGLKVPVQGDRFELSSSNEQEMTLQLETILASEWKERQNSGRDESQRDQELLAQRIFFGEIGHYAQDREELFQVIGIPFLSESNSEASSDLIGDRALAGSVSASSPGRKSQIEIEPIDP